MLFLHPQNIMLSYRKEALRPPWGQSDVFGILCFVYLHFLSYYITPEGKDIRISKTRPTEIVSLLLCSLILEICSKKKKK